MTHANTANCQIPAHHEGEPSAEAGSTHSTLIRRGDALPSGVEPWAPPEGDLA
jgi:hypothetical protein